MIVVHNYEFINLQYVMDGMYPSFTINCWFENSFCIDSKEVRTISFLILSSFHDSFCSKKNHNSYIKYRNDIFN